MMKTYKQFALAGLLTLTFAGAGRAGDDGLIIRTTPSAIGAVARQFGLKVDKDLSQGNGVYLVHPPAIPGIVQALKTHPALVSVQTNSTVGLPEVSTAGATKYPLVNQGGKIGTTLSPALAPGAHIPGVPGTLLPSYFLYMAQPGILKVKVPLDLQTGLPMRYGSGVRVAVIDTWIDSSNMVLASSIDKSKSHGAYDCITDQPGGPSVNQETSPFIDQETSPFIDGTGTVLINQETSPFIDQETSPFIDQETSPFIDGAAFGHGTMVAGLVHRIAPGATLVPVRAFRNDGGGNIADVIQAIYYAVDIAKVDVINMSFSTPSQSAELDAAIQHAKDKGVICVASVSNSNSATPVYPAFDNQTISIAASDYSDFKASFSDYGSYVDLASPGVNITSTFPKDTAGRDHWAMCSGTSFATPLVAGTVALLKSTNWTGVTASSAVGFLQVAADPVYSKGIGQGRLDVTGSIKAATGRSDNNDNQN